jgi:salicylate hydroxylase
VYLKTYEVKRSPSQRIAYDVSVFLPIFYLDHIAFSGYKDDAEIGTTSFMPRVEQEFGAPLWVVHRADLQMVLLTAARKAGVDVQTGHHVGVVDFGRRGTTGIYPPTKPRYSVNGGEWLEADVILCADGIKSDIRRDMMKIHGQIDHGTSHTPH